MKLTKIDSGRLTDTGKEVMKLGEKDTVRSKVMTGKSDAPETQITGTLAKLREEERDFLTEYRQLEQLDREKEIKFFPCVGDPAMSQDQQTMFEAKRHNKVHRSEQDRRETDITRYSTDVDNDAAVIDTDLPLEKKPQWDIYQNNHFALRKRCLGILLRCVNKLVIRHRAGKRLRMLRERLRSEQVKTKEDAQRMVREDWKTSQNMIFEEEFQF